MYLGYFELGGVEIGNAERVQRYVDNLSLGKLQAKEDFISGVHLALELPDYASPLVDEAPWVDVNDAATHGFLGMFPLTMTGIGDSTREVPTTESILNGGTNGRGRDASRELRYTAMLVGLDDLSLEAGLAWLRSAVRGNECSMHTIGCDGSDLRYFLDKPVVCDPLFGDSIQYQSTEGFDTGIVDASTPVVLRFGPEIEKEMPGRGRWDYTATDGTVVRWGGLQLGSGLRLFEEGPLILQRTNLFPNPTFSTSPAGLTAVSGAPTIKHVATGGVDDAGYVAASTPGQFTTRVNWAADSGFLGQDPYQRWQTSGGLELQAPGNAGFPVPNTKHARFISRGDGFYVDGTILGPGEDGAEDATLSIYLATAQASNVVVSILNNFGMEIESAVWATSPTFARFALRTHLGPNFRIRLATSASDLRVGGMLVEEGYGPWPEGPTFAWTGTPGASISTRTEKGVVRRNLVADPRTRSTTTWSANAAVASIVDQWLRLAPTGATTAYAFPSATVGARPPSNAGRFASLPGDNIAFSTRVRNAGTAVTYVTIGCAFYQDNGSQAPGAGSQLNTIVALNPGEERTLRFHGVNPGSATSSVTGMLPLIYIYSTAAAGIATTANIIETTDWVVESGRNAPASGVTFFDGDSWEPSSYFDGSATYSSLARDHAWLGTAHASASVVKRDGVEVRRNLALDPEARGGSWHSRWFGGSGGAGNYASITNAPDGPTDALTSYAKKTWTTASPTSGNGNVGFSVNSEPLAVTPGETISLSGWFRSSIGGLLGTRAKIQWVRTDGAFDAAFGADNVIVANRWTRMSMTAVVPAGVTGAYLLLDVDSNDPGAPSFPVGTHFEATGALAERSGTVGTYFDGATPSAPSVTASQLDGTPYSASRLVTGTATPFVIETTAVTGAYGSMVASLALRGPAAPTVQVEMISLDDNTVLAVSSFEPADAWGRYAVMTQFGRRVKLRLSSSRPFDIDQVVIENAEEIYPYLDGTTIPADENDPPNLLPDQYQTRYAVRWLGTPNNSASRLEWLGGMFIEHEDSDFRPFLEVEFGRLTRSALSIGISERLTVQEQLDPYERRYHDVAVISGPKVIRRYELRSMKVAVVEVILNAARPFAFSPPRDVPLTPAAWSGTAAFFAADPDLITNHYLNPISTGSYFGAAVSGTGNTADPLVTPVTVTDPNLLVPGVANVGTRFRRHSFTNKYLTPAGVRWVDVSYAAGVGVVFGGYFRASKDMTVTLTVSARNSSVQGATVSKTVALKKGRWTRVASDVYPDATSTLNLLTATVRASGIVAGDTLDYTAMMLVVTTNPSQPFFYGSTPTSKDFSYAWASTVGASVSRRTVVPQISQAFLLDPNLPVIPSPPRPPAVAPTLPAGQLWQRYYSTIPASDVALWADSTPVLELVGSRTQPLRNVRVRFYPNPFGYSPEQIDVNSFCGEFMVSYLPKDTRMVVDGISRGAMVQVGAAEPMVADQLVLSSKGGPVAWPEMSCAIPYVMTVDYPGATTGRLADVSLAVSRRE